MTLGLQPRDNPHCLPPLAGAQSGFECAAREGDNMLTLEAELKTYEASLPDMLKGCEGQYVVICGDEICKVLPTYDEALSWAYDTFGLQRFFVKQVNAIEPVAHFSRDVGPCAS